MQGMLPYCSVLTTTIGGLWGSAIVLLLFPFLKNSPVGSRFHEEFLVGSIVLLCFGPHKDRWVCSQTSTHIFFSSLWRHLLLRTSHRLCTHNSLWSNPVFRISLWRPFVFPFLFCSRSPFKVVNMKAQVQHTYTLEDTYCTFCCSCIEAIPIGFVHK